MSETKVVETVVWKSGNGLSNKHIIKTKGAVHGITLCGKVYPFAKISTTHWAAKKKPCASCAEINEANTEVEVADEVQQEQQEETKVEHLFEGQKVTLASLKQGVYLDLDVMPPQFDTDMDGNKVLVSGLRRTKGNITTVMVNFEIVEDQVQGEEQV